MCVLSFYSDLTTMLSFRAPFTIKQPSPPVFPGDSCEESNCQCRGVDSWLGKIPWRREGQPTPVLLAWEIPWTEEPGGPQSMGSLNSWTRLSKQTTVILAIINFFKSLPRIKQVGLRVSSLMEGRPLVT